MAIKGKEEEEGKGKEQGKGEEGMVIMDYENISKPRKLPSLNSLATILMTGANCYALTEMIKSPESKWKTVPFP